MTLPAARIPLLLSTVLESLCQIDGDSPEVVPVLSCDCLSDERRLSRELSTDPGFRFQPLHLDTETLSLRVRHLLMHVVFGPS